MNIAGREISPNHPPYLVAEASSNHGGELCRALQLIDAAKACGADAIKFQAVEADTITIDCDRPEFTIAEGPWKGRRLYELYTKTATPFPWFPALFERAREVGITAFASVFHHSAIDMLERLGCPSYKISSFEIVDIPLIRHAAATGKPLIISTGMASNREITEAVEAMGQGDNGLALLHCISSYPTPPAHADLCGIKRLKERADLYHIHGKNFQVGLSDHTVGPEIAIAATALGAALIEKHFKLTHFPNTEDGPFSMGGVPFAKMVRAIHNVWGSMQPPNDDTETFSFPLRRSLFAVADIGAGQPFTAANIRSIRPGNGLPPKMINTVIGRTATRNITRGEPLAQDMIS